MASLAEILFYVLLSSFIGLSGGFLLLQRIESAHKVTFYMVSFAVGALLGVTFFELLPESIAATGSETALLLTLAGILTFFFVEKFLSWHHHHTYGEKEVHAFSYMILLGDTVHNLIDGIILAATFIISPSLGIPTFVAIIFHEVPQEMGDFAVMSYGGMEDRRIMYYNVLSALASVAGAVVTFAFAGGIQSLTYALTGFASGHFIYIAASDLIPETKETVDLSESVIQMMLVVVGLFIMWSIEPLMTLI